MNYRKKHGFFCRDLILAMAVLVGCIGCAKPELGRVEVTPEKKTLKIGDRITFKVIAHSTKDKEMPEVVGR